MKNNNLSYWERRAAERMFEHMQKAEEAADQIAKFYLRASRYMTAQTDGIFEKYQKKYGLSEAEARRLLNTLRDKTSIDEMLQKLKSSTSNAEREELKKQLEAPAYAARIDRFQQLQNQLDLVMREVYGQEKDFATSFYTNFAEQAYYRSVFDIQQRVGIEVAFSRVDPKQIDRIVGSRWSGKNYSSRIWSNTQGLAQTLKEELLINFITGRTEREAAELIAEKFAQGSSNARRLVRTESCYLSGQMEMESYKECGIDTYVYLATLDLRTSKVCRALDGRRFPVSEQEPGKNCPPMHPWCRSTTVAHISDEALAGMQRSARDPVTGETYLVPASMTYQEWYDKYVKGNARAQANEKATRNQSSDRKQFERYREILGKEIPDSFVKFQEMKYNEPEKWKFVKLDYQRRNELIEHPELKLPNAENTVLPEGKFTKYLFDGVHSKGLAKGRGITERLGYDINNWGKFRDVIRIKASQYPAIKKDLDAYGQRYEQKIIVYGLKNKPANVVVGWIQRPDGEMSMSSAYMKEV